MAPEFVYFLKINVALMLFYAFYRLLFYKDTFFILRRAILITFFGLALLYPLMNFQDWVKQQEPIAEVILIYSDMLPVTLSAAEGTEAISWKEMVKVVCMGVYWTGMAILGLRFLIQLVSIIRLRMKSLPRYINGKKVYALNRPAGPFSFFKWVFIHPESHSTDETDEILTHEFTHARQWHSIDVIISELFCMGCWLNPFAWLLKREVRHNLEYLADNTVLKSGYDCRSYQYHLLGLAHHASTANLYNSFNVMHLKNRISMMNKKRTHSLGRAKYLMFVPLCLMLMLVSNMEAVARITKEITHNVIAAVETVTDSKEYLSLNGMITNDAGDPLGGSAIMVKNSALSTISDRNGSFRLRVPDQSQLNVVHPGMARQEIRINASMDTENLRIMLTSAESPAVAVAPATLPSPPPPPPPPVPVPVAEEEADEIFTVVEESPAFPGGEREMLKYINKTVKYPIVAQENGVQGRVVCSFVVNSDGSIVDSQVLRGIHPALDREALRVINSMPKWSPGKQRGKPVRVRFTLPIQFRLA